MAKSLCRACGETFVGVMAFDAHRVGSFGNPIYKTSRTGKQTKTVIDHTPNRRRCLTVPEMLAQGMIRNDKGWWMLQVAKPAPEAYELEEALE